ncbi:MAG: hypothetical protein FWG62_08085 [Proteobacteria bacterium]|nr:hypothetical protein [Pseudomonadota bacterium]
MKRSGKVLLVLRQVPLVLAMLLFLWILSSCAKTYPDLADKLARDTDALLVEHHVCEDINKCKAQERVFRGGYLNNGIVLVYKAGDLSQETIQDIMKLCLDAYVLHDRKQTISLKFFRETVQEEVRWFSGVKPFIHLQLKGEK